MLKKEECHTKKQKTDKKSRKRIRRDEIQCRQADFFPLQSTFYTSTGIKKGKEEKAKQLFVFVRKDEEVMEKLSEMELTIPFMVAFIEGNFNEIPSVDYYKLT